MQFRSKKKGIFFFLFDPVKDILWNMSQRTIQGSNGYIVRKGLVESNSWIYLDRFMDQ